MELPHRYDVSRDMPGHAMAPAAARARSEGSATSDGLKGAILVGRNPGSGRTAALVSCTEPYGSLSLCPPVMTNNDNWLGKPSNRQGRDCDEDDR
jgi:hypothetical protein